MRFLAIFFLLPFYKFFADATYRRYIWLVIRHGWAARYRPKYANIGVGTMFIPDALSFIYQYLEIFHHEIYRFNPKRAKPLILDCGANVGTSLMFFSHNYPDAEIHCFEPDPDVFGYLQKNTERNKLKNVQLHQKAIWTHNDFLYFAQEGADGGAVADSDQNTIKVQSQSLRELLLQYERVDFLKMDIEGAEAEVIDDCKDVLHKIDNLFIEYHSFVSSPQTLDKILAILSQNGFKYALETALHIKKPFQAIYKNGKMDIQLNIFAHRNAPSDAVIF